MQSGGLPICVLRKGIEFQSARKSVKFIDLLAVADPSIFEENVN
jgi:hypothetical protein